LTVSGGSSRGAKIRILGLDMAAPWVPGLLDRARRETEKARRRAD
jgi:hypothetical protein